MHTRYPGSTWQVLCLAYDLSIYPGSRERDHLRLTLLVRGALFRCDMCRICFPLSPHFPGLHGTRFKSALWRFNYSFFLFGWGAWYFCRLDFGTRFTQRRTWCNQKCQVEASFGSAFRDLTPTKAMQVSSRVPPWHSSAALGTAPEALFHVCIQLLTPYSVSPPI